jgi:hypothetical protein
MMFLLAEMGTSGSLDGQQRLVIKGRFAPKNFEAILRRYISKFAVSFMAAVSAPFLRLLCASSGSTRCT